MQTKHTPVSSQHVASVGYNVGSHLLEVKFRDGSLYEYSGVPYETYTALMRAGSKGQFMHTQIKPRFAGTQTG